MKGNLYIYIQYIVVPVPGFDMAVKVPFVFFFFFFCFFSSCSFPSPSSSLPFTDCEFCCCWFIFCLRELISRRSNLMRLVRPPLVRMDATMSSLSSKAFSCSSVVKCSLFSGSSRESTGEGGKKRLEGYDHEIRGIAHSRSQLTVVPCTVVEAMPVRRLWEMHPSAGVQADALRLPVGVTENSSTHLPQL